MANTQLTQTGAQVQADLNKIETLPTPTSSDNGKVLGVTSGAYALQTATGGIQEITTQYTRITDLNPGVYKLTYNGTKYLYYMGTSSTSTHTVAGGAGAVVLSVSKYSTTYWQWYYINSNSTATLPTIYYGYTYSSSGSTGSKALDSIYTGTPTDTKPQYLYHYNTTFKNTSSYSIYRYQILVFNGTGMSAFTSTSNTTATSKTQLDAKYYPNSPIFYYGTTTTISNGSTISGTYLYQSYYSIDLRYSFNTGTSALTTYSPVYIKMSVNSDGTLSPVYSATSAGHPLTNTLPSTDDGYVYVYLGNSGSTNYIIDLEPVHPCLWYKNGKIVPYSGSSGGTTYTAGTGISISSNTISNTGVAYTTTAPSSDNTDGDMKFVVLTSNPATKKNGYWYIILESTGYSGNITAQSIVAPWNVATKIKFGSAPTSDNDYDSSVNIQGVITGDTTYSNETKVYVWGITSGNTMPGVIINGVTTNGSESYTNAAEVTLTGNYDITLLYSYYAGGGSSN